MPVPQKKFALMVSLRERDLMTGESKTVAEVAPVELIEFGSPSDAIEFIKQLKVTLEKSRDTMSPLPIKPNKG